MKNIVNVLLLITSTYLCNAQVSYVGLIDKYPIELVTNIYSDGPAIGVYAYRKHNEPIAIKGMLEGKRLTLYELHNNKDTVATFVFSNYNSKSTVLNGLWMNLKSKKEMNVSLTRQFDMDIEGTWANKELIQSEALKDHYFKVLVSKDAADDEPSVKGIKIVDKHTNQLYQALTLHCQSHDINSVSVDDYNFDGYDDFSVFESSYAGPNTSSIYFLYNPQTKKFFESSFTGVSLEFDKKTKTIWEDNQCCAGRQRTRIGYKLVDNKMVQKEKHCLIYDDKKDDYVERNWKQCE